MSTKKTIIWTVGIILGLLSLGFSVYKFVYVPNKLAIAELKQEKAALETDVQITHADNKVLYQRVASLEELKDSLETTLGKVDQRAVALFHEVVQLRQFKSEQEGVIVPPTTGSGFSSAFVPSIPLDLYGMQLAFDKEGPFVSYTDTVTLGAPSTHKLTLNYKPISQKIVLSRDKKGIWSGVVELPEEIQGFLTITNLDVSIARDDFAKFMNLERPKAFQLFIDGSIVQYTKTFLNAGLTAIFSDRWKVNYAKGFGNNMHTIGVGYKLFEVR